jgi:hypothetical protein
MAAVKAASETMERTESMTTAPAGGFDPVATKARLTVVARASLVGALRPRVSSEMLRRPRDATGGDDSLIKSMT